MSAVPIPVVKPRLQFFIGRWWCGVAYGEPFGVAETPCEAYKFWLKAMKVAGYT